MCDHIVLHVEEEIHGVTPRIYVHELVAFFPDEGFLAFEGYGWIPPAQLPFLISAYRALDDGTNQTSLFKLRVTAAYKKDVLEPEEALASRVPCGCDDPIECGCGIQFFPCDLILYRFDVIHRSDDVSDREYRYCIDDRFSSVETMIDAYVALLDLPEDPWACYESRMEDMPFYTGYYRAKQRDRNLYTMPTPKVLDGGN